MFSRTIRIWAAWVASCTLLLSSARADPSRNNPDPLNGHRLALLIYSACHIAGPDQNGPPILQPPAESFQSLAQKEGTSYDQMREFILTTHQDVTHPKKMPNPMLMEQEASDIAAYIINLRRQH